MDEENIASGTADVMEASNASDAAKLKKKRILIGKREKEKMRHRKHER